MKTGASIGQYEIISLIGKGGMGEVFLAHDNKLDRRVALKILPREFAEDSDRMKRFVREARSASALNHPNIITIYEIGESGGTNYIAAEFIDGGTLNEFSRKGPLDLRFGLNVAVQIASALETAHAAGIVHRDIKPDNVMVRADGLVKLLDFGIAKISVDSTPSANAGEDATAIKGGTSPGMIIGTANYMSPEQAKGERIDARTDIFSYGVLFYEMVAGQLPFQGENALSTIAAILHKEPRPLGPDVPAEIARIIGKCLRKDRDERYQTIRDVLNDLKEVKQELEFQDRLERSAVPDTDSNATLIHNAATSSDIDGATTVRTFAGKPASKYLAASLLTLLLAGAVFFGYRYISTGKQISSIAVMPFANGSGNADADYLSDGMTETLIGSLAQLPNLNVKPRSTVFRYKGTGLDSKAIASELNVQAVLNGRVVQRGQEISVFVELIDISLDKVVWSETYNRKQADLVTLQSDIARDVSAKIKSRLSGEEIANVTRAYTTSPEAYQLYLRGNFYRTKYTEEGYKKSIEYYQKAIAIDPNYALAYHGIAEAYDFSSGWYLPSKEAEPKAKAAALKALELDETLAETHYLLGKLLFWYEWDFRAAEREWKRANELDPTYPAVYPVYLGATGRYEEALKGQDAVQERFPLDLNVSSDSALLSLYAGRYDRSIEQSRKALELDPNFWWAHQNLGLAYERKKQYPEAIAALEKARVVDAPPSSLGYLGYVYAVSGKTAEALKVRGELIELSKSRYVDPYSIACIYAGLNDKEQAFEWLERAYQERSFYIPLLRSETVFDNLRPDPRFAGLLKRVNLPE